MSYVDLNADIGEGCAEDDALLAVVSSCNIACGGHAGDQATMARTVQSASANGVAIGAHPGYPDRDGFGRESGFLKGPDLYESLTDQVAALGDIAAELGARLVHVKPHGALYNDAVADSELADIVARVTAEAPASPALMGMANTELERAAERHGLQFIAEAFIDRAYEADGTLVSRKEPGAVHENINVATMQAVRLATEGRVTSRRGEEVAVRCLLYTSDAADE